MSVIGWKKKKKILWILFGAGIVGVPMLCVVIFLTAEHMHLKTEVSEYRKRFASSNIGMAFCLKNEKKAGEVIRESDLAMVNLSGDTKTLLPEVKAQDLVGKLVKVDLKEGSMLTEQVVGEKETAGNDVRRITFTRISYAKDLKKGEYADIRISFPNGEDYIVVRHKKILKVGNAAIEEKDEMEGNALSLFMSETELLRVSSALVDTEQYEGAYVYAVPYRDTFQEASQITYPVNMQVFSLMGWDPNVERYDGVDSLEEIEKREEQLRSQLETNLLPYRKEQVPTSEDTKITESVSKDASWENDGKTEEFFP